MESSPQPVLTPAERRGALRAGALVVALVALLDGVLLRSTERAAIWGAWVALLAACGEAVVRGPAAAVRFVGAASSIGSIGLLVVLVAVTGGSQSPLFAVLPLIPSLGLVIAPDDVESAPVLASAVPVGGIGLLLVEGRPATWIALWAAPVVLAGVLVVRFARANRTRRVAAALAAQERSEALDRLARSERELARVERLARLPLLADGVAHDLNSPLAVVSSSLSFARAELGGVGPEVAEALADAADAAAKMHRIVGGLQHLALLELEHDHGASPARATELALRDALRDALASVAAQLGEAVRVRAEIADALPVVLAPRHAVVDLAVQLVRALASTRGGVIVVRAAATSGGLLLSAARAGATAEAAAARRTEAQLTVCRAYVEGLGGAFRSGPEGGELRLEATLPALQA